MSTWFWNERFWLPTNITWADLRSPGGVSNLQPGRLDDLAPALPIAACLLLVRVVLQRLLHFVLPSTQQPTPQPNAILDKVYTSIARDPDAVRLAGLAKQLDWSIRQVQVWFIARRALDRPSHAARATDALLRTALHAAIVLQAYPHFGNCTPWELSSCWASYPGPIPSPGLRRAYTLTLSTLLTFLALAAAQKPPRPWRQLFHHAIAGACLAFSYADNFVTVGALVACILDAPVCFLAAGRLLPLQLLWQLLYTASFIATRIVWIVGYLLPATLLPTQLGLFPAHFVFNGLLLLMLIVDVTWVWTLLHGLFTSRRDSDLYVSETGSDDEAVSSKETLNGYAVKSNGHTKPCIAETITSNGDIKPHRRKMASARSM